MTKIKNIIDKYGALALMAIIAIIGGMQLMGGSDAESVFSGFFITAAVWLTIIAAILAIVFPLIYTVMNPKDSIKGVVSVVAFGAFLAIMYSMASSAKSPVFQTAKYDYVTDGVMKIVSAGITTTVLLAGFALVAAIVSEIITAIK